MTERLLELGVTAATELDMRARSDEDLTLLLDAAGPMVQQDPKRAIGLLTAVSREAADRRLVGVVAKAAYLSAHAEVNNGHLEIALELIDRAERLWWQAGARFEALRTALGRMHVLDDLGRHRDAAAVARQMIDQLDGPVVGADDDDIAWLRGFAFENLGVSHGYVGEHEEALSAYESAEAVYRDRGWHHLLPQLSGNRGVELVELGRNADALTALQTAERGFDEVEDRLFAAKCLTYQARAELAMGNFVGAIESTRRAEQHIHDLHSSTEYARVQLVRAETLTSLNLLSTARALFDSTIAQFSDAGLDHDLADALLGSGVVRARLGEPDEADRAFARAARLFDAMGSIPLRAVAHLRRSELAEGDEAVAFAEMAVAGLRESGRAADHASALLRLAQLSENADEAHTHLDAAEAILDVHLLPDLRWQALHERARRYRDSGRDADARRMLEAAMEAIESVRSTVVAEHARLWFMSDRRAVHEDLIALLLDYGQVAAAHRRTERDRNRTLVERLRDRSARPFGDASRASAPDHGPGTAAPRRSLRRRSPVAPMDLGPIVTYQIIGDEILAFVEVDGAIRVHRALASTAEIHSLLARLDAQWRRFIGAPLAARGHGHMHATTVDLLQQIHERLFAPLAAQLNAESVLIVPTGTLTNIPFGALHDGVHHVIERLAVTMAPSAQTARHAAVRQRTGTRRLVLGVADQFAPRILDEARAVAATGEDSTLLIGTEATVDALRAACAQHDVIHLACHGVHQPENPLFSRLRLGDRWINAAEITQMQLDGQMVVLSACESGRQQSVGSGDEVIGLPRAFLAAGASGVVVNLWRADDASAADLMTGLHRRLGRINGARALRMAQLELLDRQPHPYQWGPAVFVGAPIHARRPL